MGFISLNENNENVILFEAEISTSIIIKEMHRNDWSLYWES